MRGRFASLSIVEAKIFTVTGDQTKLNSRRADGSVLASLYRIGGIVLQKRPK